MPNYESFEAMEIARQQGIYHEEEAVSATEETESEASAIAMLELIQGNPDPTEENKR